MDAMCADDGSVLSAGVLAESLRWALSSRCPEEALQAATDLVLRIAPCDHASIASRGRRRSLGTVAASDDRIIKADRLQYELDEGPAVDTVRIDEILLADDLRVDRRWPQWAPRAVELGLRAVITVPLFTDSPLGVLNLYSEQPRDYDELDLDAARVVAAHTAVILAHTSITQHLRRAIQTRNLIGQAQGILMARHQLTAERAFQLLRRHSQATNTRLTVLADELTRTGELPGLDLRSLPTEPNG